MKSWQKALLWTALPAAGAVCVRSHWERHHLVTEEVRVPAPALGPAFDGFRIALLADLHAADFGKDQAELTAAVRKAHPDVIIFGGDMITAKHGREKGFDGLEALLEGIAGTAPVLSVSGNHEPRLKDPDRLARLYETYGVTPLDGETRRFEREGKTLTVTGLPFSEGQYRKLARRSGLQPEDFEKVLADRGDFAVLAAHSPLWFDEYARAGADLTLSGHVHGGIIRLPVLGGVATPQWRFFFPYTRGLYTLPGAGGRTSYLAVSGGLGTHTINLRLNNPAHLLIITLTSGNGHGGNGKTGQL